MTINERFITKCTIYGRAFYKQCTGQYIYYAIIPQQNTIMYFGYIPLLKHAEEKKAFKYYWNNVRTANAATKNSLLKHLLQFTKLKYIGAFATHNFLLKNERAKFDRRIPFSHPHVGNYTTDGDGSLDISSDP